MLIFLACLHSHNITFMALKNASGAWEARASWRMHIMCMWLSESLVLKGMRWGRPGCWISQSSRLPEQTEALKENVAFPRPRMRALVLDLQLKTRWIRVQHGEHECMLGKSKLWIRTADTEHIWGILYYQCVHGTYFFFSGYWSYMKIIHQNQGFCTHPLVKMAKIPCEHTESKVHHLIILFFLTSIYTLHHT